MPLIHSSKRLPNQFDGAERLALNGIPHSAPIGMDADPRLPSLDPAYRSIHWSSTLWYNMLGLNEFAVPIETGHVSRDVDSILEVALFKITKATLSRALPILPHQGSR